MLAVNEAATNTISHSHAPGRLRLWQDAATFTCEICDGGHIRDPLAGRRPASAAAGSGHGLLVVNQVCDLVELHTGPWGTAIRMHMDRPAHESASHRDPVTPASGPPSGTRPSSGARRGGC
jgi:anti-sigma regulatory factor (Ser/Thr protein kinase)